MCQLSNNEIVLFSGYKSIGSNRIYFVLENLEYCRYSEIDDWQMLKRFYSKSKFPISKVLMQFLANFNNKILELKYYFRHKS